MLPLMPAVGLMVGQLWAYHAQLATERVEDPGVNLLRVPHWLGLGLVAIFGPLFLALPPMLVESGRLDEPEFVGMNWATALGLGSALLLITLLGIRWHFKWRPRLAAYATVAWVVTAVVISYPAYEQSHHHRYVYRGDAEKLATMTGEAEVLLLSGGGGGGGRERAPDAAFLFYANRAMPPLPAEQLADAAKQARRLCVVTRRDRALDEVMREHNFRRVLDFDDTTLRRSLYRLAEPAAETAGPAP